MVWTTFHLGIALLFLVSGSINTLSLKCTDQLKSKNTAGEEVEFSHPFLQALTMFIGEIFCFVLFKILYTVYAKRGDGSEKTKRLTKGNTDFNIFILLIPTMCDMIATCIMYIGLILTYASSYQMFRGSVMIFTGLESVVFLGRRLKLTEWAGMLLVIGGLAIVGFSDYAHVPSEDNINNNEIIIGDLLIIVAQVFVASQMVVEEKFVAGLDIPALQAVGWEGIFGLVVMGLLLIPFYFIKVGPTFSKNPRGVLEDTIDGLVQLHNNYLIVIALVISIHSIAFYNFAGISITKGISATTRMVLDSLRTIVVWLCSMAFMGQKFEWLQLLGFIVLLIGMFLYNVVPQLQSTCCNGRSEDAPATATVQD